MGLLRVLRFLECWSILSSVEEKVNPELSQAHHPCLPPLASVSTAAQGGQCFCFRHGQTEAAAFFWSPMVLLWVAGAGVCHHAA